MQPLCSLLSLFFGLDSSSNGTTRKEEQMDTKQRMEEGEANNEHQSMTQALWEHWSTHSREGGGGCGLSPLSVPQSQIHSWYPPQKRWQWLAGGRQPTPTPLPRTPLTMPPPRAPGRSLSTWLRPSQREPLWKKGQQRSFPKPRPAFTTTENTS